MRDKLWDVNLIGVIAEEKDIEESIGKNAIFINNQNTLQFYLRIISAEPDSFPRKIKVVSCFTDELEKWGFEDDFYANEIERKERLRSFLNDNLVVFNPEVRIRQDFQEYYVARNIHLIPKLDSYNESIHLNAIPIFNEKHNKITKDEFLERLSNNKYVGHNNQISKEENDTPTFIIWEDENEDMTIFGEFKNHTHAHGGFRFIPFKEIHWAKIDKEVREEESYRFNQVLFVNNENYNKITDILKTSEVVQKKIEEDLVDKKKTGEETLDVVSKESVEEKFLSELSQATKELNLVYDRKDLINFHTAMKTSNLVILAGMSGTGKSKLVQAYWKALGIDRDQLNMIPVRPSWADDSDLIGYADTVNMVYRPGDSGLINTLIKAEKEPEKLFVICFDEMNLARVEHYFSQFLSVLEMEEGKRQLQLYNEQLASRLYNSAQFPPSVTIGDNVIFVGTVNIDESTYHFSDKVLDRANVINLSILPFNNLKELVEEKKKNVATTDRLFVSKEIYDSFKNNNRNIELSDDELSFLWNVHEILQLSNSQMGIGPRIVRQIDKYIKNVPDNNVLDRKSAFDIQFVQRVLTKIRGTEDQLNNLLGFYNVQTNDITGSKLLDELNESQQISHFNLTKRIISQKSKELKLNGYTI